MRALFAATYPQRTSAPVIVGAYARRLWAPDYPFAPRRDEHERFMQEIGEGWGGPVGLARRAPSMMHDERFKDWWARYLRMSASPGAALALTRMNAEIDVRHVLQTIHVPTLILHRRDEQTLHVEHARYMARRIPNARYVELPGDDHLPWVGDQDAILDEIEEFLTGLRRGPAPDRVLATVLFTDIVGSTERAAQLGDRRWRDLLDGYYAQVRRELERFRGREIDTAGDGVFATFDGPARVIRCACEISRAVRMLGIEVRSGLHTGEIEMMGATVGGIAVHIGARVAAHAGAGEVLVSSIVRDLVAGSGLHFEDRGAHTLKGLPGEWRLFSVVC